MAKRSAGAENRAPVASLWSRGPADDPERPPAKYRSDLVKYGIPYALVILAGFVFALLDTSDADEALFVAGFGVGLGGIAVAFAHRRLWLVAPLAGFAAILIVRAATDGLENGIGPLMLVPAIAIAVYGSRRALIASLTLIVTAFIVVMLTGDEKPAISSPFRQDLTLVLITVILSVAMQDLTHRMRKQRAESEQKGVQMAALAQMTHMVATGRDARMALVEGCLSLAGAGFAALLEANPEGRLEVSAASGFDREELEAAVNSGFSIERKVLATGERRFLTGVGQRKAAREASVWLMDSDALTVLWEPIAAEEETIGVLLVGWADEIFNPELLDVPIDLIAAEAAFAIERARTNTALRRELSTDPLTGVSNRRGWDQALASALDDAGRRDEPICVAIIDLDHFKAYNDSHGHLAGDTLLKEVTASWQQTLRREDRLARYGGEEFAVILPGTELDVALPVVERMRGAVPEGETCSAGVAQWKPGEPPQALMQRADMALYRAKERGRDRTEQAE